MRQTTNEGTMRIPVMDSRLKPLMPCHPARARKLLRNGKAKAYRNKLGVFCIILNREVEPANQQLVLGVDPGSSYEGFSIVGSVYTVLNGMSETPYWVKDVVEQRRVMRCGRRYRKCPRRQCRSNNRLVNKKTLPPSTKARWNAKLRIIKQLLKIVPITTIVVEDIKAATKKGQKNWNQAFSPLEHGKQWFYLLLKEFGIDLFLKQGYETKELRDQYGLYKTKCKSKRVFESHAVDAWVLAASVSRAVKPTCLRLYYWSPIRLHRRQLHAMLPGKDGVRRPYGGTKSIDFTRGTLVRHIKYGLSYVGGTQKGKVSLHSIASGQRLTQNVKPMDIEILTTIRWRALLLSAVQ